MTDSGVQRVPVRARPVRSPGWLRPLVHWLERRTLAYRRLSLYARVLIVNASILVAATAALALTPATIPFPFGVEEASIVVGGLLIMIVANAALLRVTFGPLSRLVRLMRTIDLLRPCQRLPVSGGLEVRAVISTFNEMLERLEDERRRSTGRALSAQEEERRRIGQELHDEIGQRLTGILLQLKRALQAAPDEIRPNLLEAQEAARAMLDEVGRLAWQLRPGILDDLGLIRALEALLSTFEEHTGLRVERALDTRLPELEAQAELALYRVAQESLTNIMRHAGASRVELSLERSERGVRMGVRDDGCGMSERDLDGWGIRGMRERALQVGGDLRIETRLSAGVEISLDVPSLRSGGS